MAAATYIEDVLKTAHERFSERNLLSADAHQKAHSHLPGGNTRTVLHAEPFPITWASAKNATLTSIDGDTYVDLLGEFSAGIFGHSEARIAVAVQAALVNGWNFGGNNLLEKQFAEKVCQRFEPSGIELVRFTNSGTEANTTALAAALAITQRKKILVFSSGYHGSTLVFPMAMVKGLQVPLMNLPHDFVLAPYNNILETQRIVQNLPAESLAAILVEPIQGSGGCRPATLEFMRLLRKTADTTGGLLIVDEVMSSRLGESGLIAKIGVRADIVTLGKYVGGGMTFGAFGGRRDIMELFDPAKNRLFHPGTYNNNVVSMSAGIAGLDIYDSTAVERLNEVGKTLKEKVQAILIEEGVYPPEITSPSVNIVEIDSFEGATRFQIDDHKTTLAHPPPMFITGQGSMLNIRFSGHEALVWQAVFYHHALARNIYIATRGYTPLSLRVTGAHVEKYVSAVREFVQCHGEELRRTPMKAEKI
ncbi:hypothetical protein LTR84_004378 [Exophiala bonariae]|uniref:Acetylornithine aminotransferase n=1 Tax=Exophiala bonariae TaxID=1690606 RepID=A0AAV9N6R1_9EURO|nr:hypothetical protein LTR84_004378 [Exophiala bonariae]